MYDMMSYAWYLKIYRALIHLFRIYVFSSQPTNEKYLTNHHLESQIGR